MLNSINIFEEIENSPVTGVGIKYSLNDMLNVWKNLSNQIIDFLKEGKGLTIKGLGTFSLSNWSLETGNNSRTFDVWRPVFLISKSIAEEFDLHQPKQYVNDKVPLATVGYQQLMKNCKLSKEEVINCVEEATQCFRKMVYELKDIEFPLDPLGKLFVNQTNVTFTFREEYSRQIPIYKHPCVKYAVATVPYVKTSIFPCAIHELK